jgi:hypothetical protein
MFPLEIHSATSQVVMDQITVTGSAPVTFTAAVLAVFLLGALALTVAGLLAAVHGAVVQHVGALHDGAVSYGGRKMAVDSRPTCSESYFPCWMLTPDRMHVNAEYVPEQNS